MNTSNYDLVYFSTSTCTPCKILKPIVEKVTAEQGKNILFYTIDKEPNGMDMARDFAVQNVPTIIFFKDGEEIFRKIGTISEVQFKTLLQEKF